MISETEKLHCVERELKYRHHVYPRLVGAGKMKETVMQREIELMEAIRDDYRQRAQTERLL